MKFCKFCVRTCTLPKQLQVTGRIISSVLNMQERAILLFEIMCAKCDMTEKESPWLTLWDISLTLIWCQYRKMPMDGVKTSSITFCSVILEAEGAQKRSSGGWNSNIGAAICCQKQLHPQSIVQTKPTARADEERSLSCWFLYKSALHKEMTTQY